MKRLLLVGLLVSLLALTGCGDDGDHAWIPPPQVEQPPEEPDCSPDKIDPFNQDWEGKLYILKVIQGPPEFDEVVDLFQLEGSLVLKFDMLVNSEWWEGRMYADPKASQQADIWMLAVSNPVQGSWEWSVLGTMEMCANTVTANIDSSWGVSLIPLPLEAYQGLEFEFADVIVLPG